MLRMLDHGSNRVETIAANRSSSWNARHFLHLFGQSTKPTVLRFLIEFLFKDVDAKFHTLFTYMDLWSGDKFAHLILCLVTKRASQNFRSASQQPNDLSSAARSEERSD
jgi:hypothetical protein